LAYATGILKLMSQCSSRKL